MPPPPVGCRCASFLAERDTDAGAATCRDAAAEGSEQSSFTIFHRQKRDILRASHDTFPPSLLMVYRAVFAAITRRVFKTWCRADGDASSLAVSPSLTPLIDDVATLHAQASAVESLHHFFSSFREARLRFFAAAAISAER